MATKLKLNPNKVYSDPAYFMEHILNFHPTDQQKELTAAIEKGEGKIALRSGHGIGKTTDIACIGLWFLGTRMNCKIIYTSVKADQLREQVWSEMRIWLNKADPTFRKAIEIQATKAYRRDNEHGAVALARVAPKGKAEAQAGWHHEHLLIIVDEASGVEDEFIESLEGGLTQADNVLILSGNPTRRTGQFFRCFHQERGEWYTIHCSSLDSPLVSKTYPETIERRYGKESNIYKIRVLGDFPESDSDSLIMLDWIERAGERSTDNTREPVIIGVDPGRSVDGDATGLIARSGNRILAARQIWVRDLMEVAGHAIQLKRDITAAWGDIPWGHFAVDVIGLGAGVYDSLRAQGEECIEVNVAGAAIPRWNESEGPVAANLKADLWLATRDWIRDCGSFRGIEGDEREVLISELCAPKYGLNQKGEIVIESKQAMKKRGLSSPNLADALCLTFNPGIESQIGWVQSV